MENFFLNFVLRIILKSNLFFNCTVYGNKKKKVSEKDVLRPMSPYPKSKLLLEKYLEKNKKKINCVILR